MHFVQEAPVQQEPFKPDLACYFHSFAEEYDLVPAVAREAHRIAAPSFMDALYLAWCDAHGSNDAVLRLRLIGAEEFRKRFCRALEDAQTGLQDVLNKYVPTYREQIDPVDEIGSCNDPSLLFAIAGGGLDGADHRLDRASQIEARRKLAIAAQFLEIGAIDPFELVSADLTEVNLLARRKLFRPLDRVTLRVTVRLIADAETYIHPDAPITVCENEHPRTLIGERMCEIPFSCRVAEDGDTTYFVQTHSRPKTRISAVIKLEAGRVLSDRRALRHVLVAVSEHGRMRAAEASDMADFIELARKRLWTDELAEEQVDDAPNPFRSARYEDMKIVGRYVNAKRPHFLPRVEHQVTHVRAHLDGERSPGSMSHHAYKEKIVWGVVLPRWWRREWYGIDWKR